MDANTLDAVLSELLEVLGEYSKHLLIGGGVSLLIYRHYLTPNESQAPEPATTKDIDLLVPRKIPEDEKLLDALLLEAGFKRVTNSIETPPVEAYEKTIHSEDIVLEFLTDRRVRAKQDKNVLVAGISAQPLSYIEMSRETPIEISTRSGSKALVVSTAPWMFHKALIFPRRRSTGKQCKDLYGIWYVGCQLGDFSRKALEELKQLAAVRPASWRKDAVDQVNKWVNKATPKDWAELEAQDPAQVPSRERFQRFIEEDFLPSIRLER